MKLDIRCISRLRRQLLPVLLTCAWILVGPSLALGQGAGNTLSFDGINEYVSVPGGGGLAAATEGTVEMWVRWSGTQDGAAAGFGPVLARQSNGVFSNNVITLSAANPATAQVQWRPFSAGGVELTSATSVEDGRWRHVAVTFTNNDHRMYVDGALEDSSMTPGAMNSNTTVPLTIGAWIDDGMGYSTSQIDEVRVWSSVLSASDIRSGMCQKLVGNEAGLVAYYRLDASSGTTATNTQGNAAFDGTLVNMEDGDRVTSGAPVGDTCTTDFDSTGGFTVNLAGPNGDSLTATTTGGTINGLAVYRVDGSPNVTTPPAGFDTLSSINYFGVWVSGSASPAYTVLYSYLGHPGIQDENQLGLGSRPDNASLSWNDLGATLDTGAHTLTKIGESGTEYILIGTSNILPVELSFFEVR